MAAGQLTDDAPVAISRRFRLQWEEAQQCYVLLYPEGLIKLSDSAGEIFKRIDGARTVGEVIRDLEQAYPEADLREDVLDFLRTANEQGWIRCK